MDDELAFLRAAAAEPDDDTIRLVYADWLEERGDDASATQAAFARLQVRRSQRDVFDPDRKELLEQEAGYLRKHKRDWNGRIHRRIYQSGLPNLVGARRGQIRGWDYHRGMISRVRVAAEGLAAHAELVFTLGPVQALELVGWSGWSKAEQRVLEPHFAGVKVLTLRWPALPLAGLASFSPLRQALILDLRHVPNVAQHLPGLLHHASVGELPPVVLFRRPVQTTRPYTYGGHQYTQVTSCDEDHVIDPFGQWGSLRLWFGDFTGTVLTPRPYQGATR